mgnify:CR=1 FL=1
MENAKGVAVKALIACEFSGIVRGEFLRHGHQAVSCDLLPSEVPGPHIQGDVMDILNDGWDLLISFPPCTHLCVSGARWFKDKRVEQEQALEFVRVLLAAPVPHIALENPVGIISTRIRPPDQVLQPYQFGHGECKATCLWLKNLPPLMPTHADDDLFVPPTPAGREQRVFKMPPGPNRWKERSRTFSGVSQAMASQWPAWIGKYPTPMPLDLAGAVGT